jgi:hypothetical protein
LPFALTITQKDQDFKIFKKNLKINKSDTPRKAGGLMSWAASKAVNPLAKRRAKARLSCQI